MAAKRGQAYGEMITHIPQIGWYMSPRYRFPALAAGLLALAALSTPTPEARASGSPGLNRRATVRIRWVDSTGTPLEDPLSRSGRPRMVVTAKGLQNLRGADIQILIFTCHGREIPDAWLGNGTGGCNDGNWQLELGAPGTAFPNAFAEVPGLTFLAHGEGSLPAGCNFNNWPTKLLRLDAYGTAGVVLDSTQEYALWSVQFDLRGQNHGGPTDCAGDLSHADFTDAIWLLADPLLPPFQGTICESGYTPDSKIWLLDGPGQFDSIALMPNRFFGYYSLAWTPAPGDFLFGGICPTDAVRATTWGELRRIFRAGGATRPAN